MQQKLWMKGYFWKDFLNLKASPRFFDNIIYKCICMGINTHMYKSYSRIDEMHYLEMILLLWPVISFTMSVFFKKEKKVSEIVTCSSCTKIIWVTSTTWGCDFGSSGSLLTAWEFLLLYTFASQSGSFHHFPGFLHSPAALCVKETFLLSHTCVLHNTALF